MPIKEIIKDYIDRIEHMFDVLVGGLLGGLATNYVMIGNSKGIWIAFWFIVGLLIIFAALKKFWLKD